MKTNATIQLMIATSAMITSVHAAAIVDVDPGRPVLTNMYSAPGSFFLFPTAGRYSAVNDSGYDRSVTIDAAPSSTDFFLVNNFATESSGAANELSIDTTVYRYAQIFYTLSTDFTGSANALRLATDSNGAAFVTFNNSGSIPTSAGSHSIVIDLVDGTSISGGYSGDLIEFRWDFWNNPGNENKSFTLHRVIFGSGISSNAPAIPDGGFESPQLSNFTLGTNVLGSLWSFGSVSGITPNGSAFAPPAAPDGSQAAIVRSSNTSSAIVEGFKHDTTYRITLKAAGRNTTPNDFRVALGGMDLIFGGSTTIDPPVGSYASYTSDDFKVAEGDLLLELIGLIGGDRTAFVDDIQIHFVAYEPSGTVIVIR